ncbi:Stf0 family sulfotransferase [Vreelandella titanicae]|uniref:Sulphotransferase Stf0 domain-containing protein n=1 Tax=Vreelandella titanicae TaxID=664683 RepID=A0A558J1S3_9GAMM|nr:Stf0 family sulfotransferase [Halomonas titanicae]TVU87589.1 hypothetical protein FQP89_20800 [Halomonas titanicae]
MKKIIILSTQRSGSTMVCDDIAGTEKLGRPSEYFIKVIDSLNKVSQDELKVLIEEALIKGETNNGITALKIMSNQVAPIGSALQKAAISDDKSPLDAFYNFFKDYFFIRVARENKVAQAVSRVMASQTDIYHTADNVLGMEGMLGKVAQTRDDSKLLYNHDAIENSLNKICIEEEFIDHFISYYNIDIFNVIYENAISDRSYVHEISRRMLGEEVTLKTRRLKKISSKVSDEWVDRYVSEE